MAGLLQQLHGRLPSHWQHTSASAGAFTKSIPFSCLALRESRVTHTCMMHGSSCPERANRKPYMSLDTCRTANAYVTDGLHFSVSVVYGGVAYRSVADLNFQKW